MSKAMGSPYFFKGILAATDGSEAGKRATTVAIGLAKRYQAKLILLTVVPTQSALAATSNMMNMGGSSRDWRELAENILGDAASEAREEDVKVETKTIENISSTVHAIIKCAEDEKVDLIVLGRRGVGGFEKLLVGSVSSGVVSHASCSVFLVR